MRFLDAYQVEDKDNPNVVAVVYLNDRKERCTSFYKAGSPTGIEPLIKLIKQTVEQDKRDLDDGK